MVELVRSGNVVSCNGIKLTMVEQKTKGPGNEVVKIEGLPGANGQKWVSLRSLQEGLNQVNTKGREVVATQSYTLNMVEKAEIDKLQNRINEIKEIAKQRYVAKPTFVDPTGLTKEQRELKAQEIEKYLKALRGE
jgi:hypothetical protein